jgi:ribokinase
LDVTEVKQASGAGQPARANVVVVGSLNMDLVARTPRQPLPGETLTGHGFATTPGGKGANQAVAIARLGAPVAMIGCVGDDDYGRVLLANLEREGIDLRGVQVSRTQPTGVAMIIVDDASQNSIVVVPGSNGELTPVEVDRFDTLLRAAKLVVCQLEVPLETVQHTLKTARRYGCTTILNAAPAYPLPKDTLALVDWLVVNEVEATALTDLPIADPADARQAALRLRAQGCGNVLITLGAQGVVAAFGEELRHYAAQKVTPVDTTGAGDTFVGGFAAALAGAAGADEAIRYGQAAAAIAVTRVGAQSAIPHRDEIQTL